MFEFINYSSDKIQLLVLIILRASGLFLMAPVIGHRHIPKTIKIGLVLLLSLMLVPSLRMSEIPMAGSVIELIGLAGKELLVGLIIGLVFRLLFMGVYTAGSIASYQMGFAIVTVFDKNLTNQVAILGRFWWLLAMLIFMSINGHHLIIKAFATSYEVLPPGGLQVSSGLAMLIVQLTAYVFVIGLKIAAPIMITLFLTDVALGTIAKTMPTMNVFFVGFPIKIATGLMVMAISLPVFSYVLQETTIYLDDQMLIIFSAMGKA